MAGFWKMHAFSLATTLGMAYILCAIFDALFPPFGLLAALAPASPWPISGSPIAFLVGFVLLTATGFALGALYGTAWGFWSKKTAVRSVLDMDTLKRVDWLPPWRAHAFRDVHFDYDMEVEKCGMTA